MQGGHSALGLNLTEASSDPFILSDIERSTLANQHFVLKESNSEIEGPGQSKYKLVELDANPNLIDKIIRWVSIISDYSLYREYTY